MDSIVAVDIETTGLNSKEDAIIEIGAVRFNERRIEGEWSSLVNPGRRIPPFITQLTGINDRMVVNAPPIHDVIDELESFVGDAPVLGHNVKFDLAFLRRHRILRRNDMIDTYDMAAVLLPGASRYNLGALAQALVVPFPATHRALEDARATRGIFLRLYEEAQRLPLNILAEIVRLGEPIEWGGALPFSMALRSRSKETLSAESMRFAYQGPLFTEKAEHPLTPLNPVSEPVPLDEEDISAILEPGGEFAGHFPHFEYRTQQVEMLRAITNALSDGRHLLVESGTGIGKSIAYLIPAALWAMQNNRRVVISTNTINLQDQLINKDIPDIRAALGLDLRATVLKGRSNYLCPRRLESLRRRGPSYAEELRILAKVLVWLQGTHTGDRGELNLNSKAERNVWMRLSAEDEGCTAENCLRHTGGACPFYRARQAAQSAHVIIVNHALLLADVSSGYHVLPEYEYLIVDEAHHLEDATTNALSFQITQGDVERLLREIGGPTTGLLGWLLSATQSILDPGEFAALNHLVQRVTDHAFQFDNLSRQFFLGVDHFLGEQREGRQVGMYSHQERILSATRIQPAWADVEVSWDESQHVLQPLLKNLGLVIQGLAEITDTLAEEDEELYGILSNIFRQFSEINDHLNALVFDPAPDRVYWAEAQPSGSRLSLHAAPLHIGPLMEHYLWREKLSVILTSATLTTAGEFDYIRGRLNAEDAYELGLGSPFDYETSTLLYLVNDIPEPSDRHGHQRAVIRSLIELCKATGGGTLVLFTSYDQLRRTSKAITPVLAQEEILTFSQGDGASPHTLLETFRNTERAVLLGTRSFWEGVDIPGDALTSLVIVKIPFDVPSDPIIAARSETFEDPFYQYSLPEAILRFRQGFGRLIRSQYDRGIVVVLDRRILTKNYGRYIIESLPTCTTSIGPIADLSKSAQKWLNI
jgi:DNA polymerase-3 subunit epsilon/ATP-dependent DNA helicase DinG